MTTSRNYPPPSGISETWVNPDVDTAFATRLRAQLRVARTAKRLTRTDVAEALTPQRKQVTVRAWEHGHVTIDVAELWQLCHVLGINLEQLIKRTMIDLGRCGPDLTDIDDELRDWLRHAYRNAG